MRNFILGTDWWTDCDDAMAVRLLARAHKAGKICLKGIGMNACMEYSVKSLDGFLHAEGVCDIPIGIDAEATDFGGKGAFQKNLSLLPSRYSSNADAEDATRLYRRILSESKEKIEIIEIGFMNVISAVIESGPDDISDMSGMKLIKEKVNKIWVMAGKWDEACGKEHNFEKNERSRIAGNILCEKCPVPITFLGWEVGADVITGGNLKEDDVLKKVLCDHGSPNGRSSWDPMLVMLALTGDESNAGYDVVCGKAEVNRLNGENNFYPSNNGKHKYVIKKENNEYYKNQINALLASE